MIYCLGFTAIYFKLTIIGNILVKNKNKTKTEPSDEKDNALRKIKFEKIVFSPRRVVLFKWRNKMATIHWPSSELKGH